MKKNGLQFKLKATPPSPEEEKLFGIFISHSNANVDYLNELTAKMQENHLNPIFDRDFLKGGEYFQNKIRECIKCYACVIIITKEAMASDWVHYECGYFSHSANPVVIWDPENILSLKTVGNDLLNFHLSQYLPAVQTADQVVAKLKTLSVYADLFQDECLNFSLSDFRATLDQKVTTAMVHLSSDLLTGRKELFKECKLSTLVVNFGMFYAKQGDGEHCWAKRTMNANGTYSADSSCLLSDRKCKLTGEKCTLYSEGNIDRDKKECIILNHIMTNGRYFDKGEKDYSKNMLETGMLSFYVPVHKVYGTEFKFIVDSPTHAKHIELMRLFEDMGLNPTVSDSLNGWRIYLSIPETPYHGFFRLNHLFSNNFLCPRSVTPIEER